MQVVRPYHVCVRQNRGTPIVARVYRLTVRDRPQSELNKDDNRLQWDATGNSHT